LFFIRFLKQKFLHDRPRIGSLVPEAAMIILVGMMAGYLLHFVVHTDTVVVSDAAGNYEDVAESIFSFSPTIFFIVLLPPIIFNSGYHLQRDLFFRYITPICLYACVGTAICTIVVAGVLYAVSLAFATDYFAPTFLELLAFGALVSATDPV
jgi:solute carrier family 9 (sodium/hydrogen exchanger), member 8